MQNNLKLLYLTNHDLKVKHLVVKKSYNDKFLYPNILDFVFSILEFP